MAVRSAGYTAEDLDDDDENDGSSIEEEEDDAEEAQQIPPVAQVQPAAQLSDSEPKDAERGRPRYPEKAHAKEVAAAVEPFVDVKRQSGTPQGVPILSMPIPKRVPTAGILASSSPPLDPRAMGVAGLVGHMRTQDRPPTPMALLGHGAGNDSGSGTPRRRVSIQLEPKGDPAMASPRTGATPGAPGRASIESSQLLAAASEAADGGRA